jgi:hypothetical protein
MNNKIYFVLSIISFSFYASEQKKPQRKIVQKVIISKDPNTGKCIFIYPNGMIIQVIKDGYFVTYPGCSPVYRHLGK